MEELLEKAKKYAEQAEVFVTTRQETPVHFEANRLKMLQTRESTWVALRIIRNGKIGASSTTRIHELDALVEEAVEMSQFGIVAAVEHPAPTPFPKVKVYDPQVGKVSIEEMVGLGQSLIDQIRSGYPEVLCEGGVSRSTSKVELINSRGARAGYKRSVFSVGMEGTLIRGTDMLFVGDWDSSCHPIKDTTPLRDEIVRQLEWAKEIVPAPTGSVPVVFSPRGVSNALLFPLLMAFNGRSIVQGSSPLIGKLGERLFDEQFNVWDDPTIPYRPGSRICDDEGIPSQRMSLIQNGVVANFLYDLQTAGQAKARTTGSAVRAGSMPTPSTSVEIIGEGKVSYQDMLSGIKEGLLVEQLLGAGQTNIMGGDFGGNVLLGYKIEKGKITGRVKDTMIAGNVYEVLKKIRAIGSKAEWVGGSLCTPPLCLDGVTVSSKGS